MLKALLSLLAALLAAEAALLGAYLRTENVEISGPAGILLAPLGIEPEGLYMPDYRPLLPWFGVFLVGLFLGNVAYGRDAGDKVADGPPSYAAPIFLLGRHTLLIYLIHQPVLISALWVAGLI